MRKEICLARQTMTCWFLSVIGSFFLKKEEEKIEISEENVRLNGNLFRSNSDTSISLSVYSLLEKNVCLSFNQM